MSLHHCAIAGLGAGCLGTTLGLGGGLVLVPMWVAYGIPPSVCSATSSFLIVWNSLIAITQIAFEGFYQLDLTGLLLLLSLLCPSLGIRGLGLILGEGGIGLLYVILGVMLLSLCVITIHSLAEIWAGQLDLFSWGTLCGN
jgi:uncharacterized membrane protein YfcA